MKRQRTKKTTIIGLAGLAVIVAGIGVTITRADQAAPTTAPTPTTSSRTAVAAAPAPTPTPTPVVYGHDGLAGQYARQLGHDSLSEACGAGHAWTCGVERVAPSLGNVALGETSTVRDVFTRTPPIDGDQAAQEWLQASPASVTGIRLRDTSQFSVTTIGTAGRTT